MLEKINQTADYIRSKVTDLPKTAIILGTGLGALVDHIEDKQYIPYTEIPNFHATQRETRIDRRRPFRQSDIRPPRQQTHHGHAGTLPFL